MGPGRDDHAVNDPGLTELGHEQARRTAARLARAGPLDELLVSTARRSQHTAAPIIDAVEPPPVSEDWLHEIRRPDEWDDTPAREIGRILREARGRPRDEWWDGALGGESFRDFHQRVTDGVEDALAQRGVVRHPEDPEHLWVVPEDTGRIVVVAHAGTNSVLLGHLLGLPPQPWEWERFSSAHASVTVLTSVRISIGHIFSLQYFSDVSHLDADQVTR